MTASEAIAWLTEDKAFGQECYSRKQIAQLIAKQHQTICNLQAERETSQEKYESLISQAKCAVVEACHRCADRRYYVITENDCKKCHVRKLIEMIKQSEAAGNG